MPALQSYWLPIHVSVVSLGSGVFLVSGVASILFLLKLSKFAEPGSAKFVQMALTLTLLAGVYQLALGLAEALMRSLVMSQRLPAHGDFER